MKLKICGINNLENLKELIKVCEDLNILPNYLGFISYPKSMRYVSPTGAAELLKIVPESLKKVLVVVDIGKDDLAKYMAGTKFNAIQFHGRENENEIKEFKTRYPRVEIIKAIKVSSEKDLVGLEKFIGLIDMFLFDAAGEKPGGNGVKFSWDILKKYELDVPFLLSGGITLEDLERIKKLNASISTLAGIDVNSGFEEKPGIKNLNKVQELLRSLRNEFSS